MAGDYIPGKESVQVPFTLVFGQNLQLRAQLLGVSADTVTQYLALQDEFAALYNECANDNQRTPAKMTLKQTKRRQLIKLTRTLAQRVQKSPNMTDEIRRELGITIPKEGKSRTNPPGFSPYVRVVRTVGRTVIVQLGQDSERRRRPAGVAGATIVTATGDAPPMSADDYRFALNTTRTTVSVPFGPSDKGDTVWISAFWTNSRDESGPASLPVRVDLPESPALPTTAGGKNIRLAA